jgi:hypothetical protein
VTTSTQLYEGWTRLSFQTFLLNDNSAVTYAVLISVSLVRNVFIASQMTELRTCLGVIDREDLVGFLTGPEIKGYSHCLRCSPGAL